MPYTLQIGAGSECAAELSVNTSGPAPVMLWREDDPDKRAAQVAQIKRLEEEGKRVITISWRTSDDPEQSSISPSLKTDAWPGVRSFHRDWRLLGDDPPPMVARLCAGVSTGYSP